jgi:hypothetical protein
MDPRSALLTSSACFVLLLCTRAGADPVRIQPIAVTASSQYGSYGPSLTVDGDSDTYWNAGGHPSQWIQLDLGRPVSVQKIRVQFAPNPAGQQQGNIIVSGDGTTWTSTSACYWNKSISDREWLDFTTDQDFQVTPPPVYWWYCHYDSVNEHGGRIRYIRITTTSSNSWVAIREIEVYGGLEYLGYFRDAAQWGNNIPDTKASGANLAWIGVSNTADLTARLASALANGVKAVVDVDPDYMCLWADRRTLVESSSLAKCWNSIKTAINDGGYQDAVAAFYLMDEPYISLTSTGNYATQRTNLTTLRDMVKADFPGIAVAAIVSVVGGGGPGELEAGAPHPITSAELAMFDWVGFDYYVESHGALQSYVNRLRGLLTNAQRMIAVPAAGAAAGWYTFTDTTNATLEREIETNHQFWMSNILSDAKYVAIVPFMWTQGTGTGFTGARDLQWLSARQFELAYSVLNLPPGDTHVFPLSWSVSSSYSGFLPFAMFDRNASTNWNSGGYPQQRIGAVLLGPTRVSKIQLTVHQNPSGYTSHRIRAKRPDGSWFVLREFRGRTTDGQVLKHDLSPPQDLVEIEVLTLKGPSWVGWKEVEIFR